MPAREKTRREGNHREKWAPSASPPSAASDGARERQSLPGNFFFAKRRKKARKVGAEAAESAAPGGAAGSPGGYLLVLRVPLRLVPLHHGPRRDLLRAPAVA